jgi:hypothetical protein
MAKLKVKVSEYSPGSIIRDMRNAIEVRWSKEVEVTDGSLARQARRDGGDGWLRVGSRSRQAADWGETTGNSRKELGRQSNNFTLN